ncbi:MAG TPA: phage portal protein, partial [Planctomycetaceae bacterium]|nr:phage portal protein [Planctomycetaceae bacterium]
MIAPVIDHEATLNFLGELSRREKTGAISAVRLSNGRSLRLMKNERTGEIRAAYDSAQTTEANKNYWANADLLSADAANSREIRQTLRSRSRYECHEGNTFARSIVNKLARDTINRGPQLQLQLKNKEANTNIERRFTLWAKRIKLARKLRTARKAKFVDGEVFIRLVTNRRLKGPIKLDIEVVEADRVTNPLGYDDESREIDGVVFDDEGNVEGYRVLKAHPGGNSFLSTSLEPEFVPAEQMIHLFR